MLQWFSSVHIFSHLIADLQTTFNDLDSDIFLLPQKILIAKKVRVLIDSHPSLCYPHR